MSFRKMQILGRAGSDAQLRTTDGGTDVASVSVATEEYHDDETVWASVVAFGQRAQFLADYCSKGDYVFAEGRPQIDEWEGDNGTRCKLEVVADTVKVPKLERGSGGGGGQQTGPPAPQEPRDDSFSDENIPF